MSFQYSLKVEITEQTHILSWTVFSIIPQIRFKCSKISNPLEISLIAFNKISYFLSYDKQLSNYSKMKNSTIFQVRSLKVYFFPTYAPGVSVFFRPSIAIPKKQFTMSQKSCYRKWVNKIGDMKTCTEKLNIMNKKM